jgi:transposase
MNPAQSVFNHIVAFDVAKHSLAVHILPGDERQTIPNKPKAIRKLLIAQKRHNANLNLGPLLAVCEATGGYERHLLEICVELGIAAHKAHGSRVRYFAKYRGLLAKTDPIDARVLALFGLKTEDLRLYAPPAPELQALAALRARQDQIQAMLLAETNRLEHVRHASVSRSLNRAYRNLTLLAYMPELGTFSRAGAACLAGVAPFDDDSGKSSLPRHIAAGRAAVRKVLYMAALTAIRHNRIMKTYAEKLRHKGKPAKVVITAIMRKLIVTLNAILRTGQPWKHAQTA